MAHAGKRLADASPPAPLVPTCFNCGKKGHKVPDSPSKVIVCFNCGGKGHKSPECPEKKVKSKSCKRIVSKYGPYCGKVISGSVNDQEATFRLIQVLK